MIRFLPRLTSHVPRLLSMKSVFTIAFLTVGAGLIWEAAVDRKDVRLDNNRFAPSIITARPGDTLVFTNGRGGPHNVQFADDSITDQVHRLIDAAMPDRPKAPWSRDVPLASPLLVLDGDTYKVVVPALPYGRYRFFCTPHVMGGMRGELVVVP
jgi:plastocyanin